MVTQYVVWLIAFPWLLGAYALFLVGTIVLTRATPVQDWLMSRLASRVGLGVPVDLDTRVRDRVRRRTLAGSVGGLLGLLAAVGASAIAVQSGALPGSEGSGFSSVSLVEIYGVLAVSATSSGVGVAWAALRSETPRPEERRIARSRAVPVIDYLPPILRLGAWPVIGFAVVTIVLVGLASGVTPTLVAGGAVVVIGLASLVVFEVVSRRIVLRGHPVSGTDELVWDDALRSEALRDLLYSPLLAVSLGTLWSLAGPGDSWPAPFALIPAGLCLACVVLLSFVYRHTRTWYLEELWPGARRRTPEEEAARITSARQATEASAR